jgi:hypothetical protein
MHASSAGMSSSQRRPIAAASPTDPCSPAATVLEVGDALRDALLEQRQEQVGLAPEARVDRTLRETGLAYDHLERRSRPSRA